MIKSSSILATTLIILFCFLPLAPELASLNIRIIVGGLICFALVLLGLLIFYKLVSLNIKRTVEADIRKEQNKLPYKEVPESIMRSLGIYNDISIRNYWTYRVLGVLSLATSLFLTIAIGQLGKDDKFIPVYITQVIAYISALSTGIIFTFNLVEKSNRARKAFRHLLNAIMMYQYGELSMSDLLKRYSEAEDYLGDDEFKNSTGNSSRAG